MVSLLWNPELGLRKWQPVGFSEAASVEMKVKGSWGGIYSWRKEKGGRQDKGGVGRGGFIVRLCLLPDLNESNDLVYCQEHEWIARCGGGGDKGWRGEAHYVVIIIVNSQLFLSSPSYYCQKEKKRKGEILPPSIFAASSKSQHRQICWIGTRFIAFRVP